MLGIRVKILKRRVIPLLKSLHFRGKADINHKELWEDQLENVWSI